MTLEGSTKRIHDYPELLRAAQGQRAREYRAFAQDPSLPTLSGYQRELVPWLAGAVEYAERYGSLAQEARRWRLGFFGALLALLVAVWALAVIARSSKVVPYVVQVDQHGFAVAIAPAEKASPADPRVVTSSLARWVRAMRTVLHDPVAQRRLVEDTFAMLAPKTAASAKVRAFLEEQAAGPRERRVEVEIRRVAPMSDKTFVVEWAEHASTGATTTVSHFSALCTLALSPTRTLGEVIANPLGIYVTDLAVTQLQ